MSKFAIAGVLSLICSGLVFGYQAISSVMGPKAKFITIYPVDLLNPGLVEWIDNIPSDSIYKMIDFVITTPLYLLLIILGVILLIISSFFWRR